MYGKIVNGKIEVVSDSLTTAEKVSYSAGSEYCREVFGIKRIVFDRSPRSPFYDYPEVPIRDEQNFVEDDDSITILPSPVLKVGEVLELAREAEIERRIRERYTQGQEMALSRQRETKPEKFGTYSDYCNSCISAVDAEIAILI